MLLSLDDETKAQGHRACESQSWKANSGLSDPEACVS